MKISQVAPFPMVGVGASAGGLNAFTSLLQALPAKPGMAIVLVQHLDPHHKSQLTYILSRVVELPVVEISDGMPVEIDQIHVIPHNVYLAISKGTFALTPRAAHPGLNMPINYFLRSLASEMGRRALGVVLSGGGKDGTAGLEAIKAAGGITFAQSDAPAAHASMPHSAIASGAVDIVLPSAGIARELVRCIRHPYVAAPIVSDARRRGSAWRGGHGAVHATR